MTDTLQDMAKQLAAKEALQLIQNARLLGVGTGSTVNFFIDHLAALKHKLDAVVPTSLATEKRLKAIGMPLADLNSVSYLDFYVDGADEYNDHRYLIKGGGGALTREKIVASVAKTFICIVDNTKHVDVLGRFPLAIEVIPMARSFVAREIVKLKGDPVYRQGFTTDNGNIILDVHNLEILNPVEMELMINSIPGVVENGIFARRKADKLLIGDQKGVALL